MLTWKTALYVAMCILAAGLFRYSVPHLSAVWVSPISGTSSYINDWIAILADEIALAIVLWGIVLVPVRHNVRFAVSVQVALLILSGTASLGFGRILGHPSIVSKVTVLQLGWLPSVQKVVGFGLLLLSGLTLKQQLRKPS